MENTGEIYLGLPRLQIRNCFPSCFWNLILHIVSVGFFWGRRYLWYDTTTVIPSSEHAANWGGTHRCFAKMMSGNVCRGPLQALIVWLFSAVNYICLVPGWQDAYWCSALGCAVPNTLLFWAVAAKLAPGPREGNAIALAVCWGLLWALWMYVSFSWHCLGNFWEPLFLCMIVFREMVDEGMSIRKNKVDAGQQKKAILTILWLILL